MAQPIYSRLLGTDLEFDAGGALSRATLSVVNGVTAVKQNLGILVTVQTHGLAGAVGVQSVTDSKGNHYSVIGNVVDGNYRISVFAAVGALPLDPSTGDTITATLLAGVDTVLMVADEFSGLTSVTNRLIDISITATGASTSPSSGNFTTLNATDLLYGAIGTEAVDGDVFTPGSGWTLTGNPGASAGMPTPNVLQTMVQAVSATGTYHADGTLASSASWLAYGIGLVGDRPIVTPKGVGKLLPKSRAKANLAGVGVLGGRLHPQGKLAGVGTLTAGARATVKAQARLAGVGKLGVTLLAELWIRLGHLIGLVNALNTHRGTDTPNRIATIENDFAASPPYRDLVDGIYGALSAYQKGSASAFITQLQGLAQSLVVRTLNDNAKSPDARLATALAELVSQMQATNQTVKRCVVAATWAADPTNSGNAALVVGMKDGKGLPLEYAFAEPVVLTCTADTQQGGVAGSETLTARGALAGSSELNFDFPLGSGAVTTLSASDESGSQTLLGDGGFESWTTPAAGGALQLARWSVLTGTWGTTLARSSGVGLDVAYKGQYALDFISNGAELTSLYQALSLSKLAPETNYAVNCWVRVSTVPGAGTLELALCNNTTPTSATPTFATTTDDQGASNVVDLVLTSATTTYAQFSGVLRTARALPANPYLVVRLIAALTSGIVLSIDSLTLTPMTQLYPGGPFVTVCAGSQRLVQRDDYTITVTNDRAGAFQTAAEKLFAMRSLGLVLPSSASPSISDSLII